jgi:anti-sigma-K factor RskA
LSRQERKMNVWKISTFVLGAACAVSLVYATAPSAQADAQPNMQAAIENLQKAKDALQKATADKGGHRVKAIAATNEAIEETKKGIAYDNHH